MSMHPYVTISCMEGKKCVCITVNYDDCKSDFSVVIRNDGIQKGLVTRDTHAQMMPRIEE